MILAKDADQAIYKVCKKLQRAPEYSPRGQKTKEIMQQTIQIANPKYAIINNEARKLSRSYLQHELDWYKSGDKSVEKIGEYASLWKRIADENGEVNSNYGEIVFKQTLEKLEGNQFDWVVDSLKSDKDSRQAIINFNQPKHKYDNVKDFPCTINTQYMIRDNKLVGITNMRSNDAIFGFGNDIPFFGWLQNQVLVSLKKDTPQLKMGPMYHTAGSLHVYEKHFKMMDNIVNEYERNKPKSSSIDELV